MPNWPTNNTCELEVACLNDLIREFDADKLHWLSNAELVRYQSIASTSRKRQFLAGHYLVRKIASRVAGNGFGDWIYFQDEENLRRMKDSNNRFPILHVSISHSGDWIAAAVSVAPIGIDIENFAKQRDFMAIARHVFSDAEVKVLEACKPLHLAQNFYLYWTLKESIAKQFGSGLKFEVSRSQSAKPVPGSVQADILSWLCADYVLAVATNSSDGIQTNGLCPGVIAQRWQNA